MPQSEDPTLLHLFTRRRRLRWTQRYVAERMGTAQSHLCDLESGRVQPSYPTLVKWAQALGLRLTWTVEVPLMICLPCKEKRHSECPEGTWCDCQHREPVEQLTPEQAADELARETRAMEEPLLDDGHTYTGVGWPGAA